MNRRRVVLGGLAAAAAAMPTIVRAQTTTGGCTVGFRNGILQFSADCSTLSIPGLSFEVSPPSHMVGQVDDGTGSTTNTVQDERIERLQRRRDKKRRKQDRQQGKHDNRRNQRSRLRDNRHNQKVRQRLPDDSTVSGTGPALSSTFSLDDGLYVATASISANSPVPGPFVATLLGPSGFTSTLFDVLPTNPGTNTYQTTVHLPEGSGYIWDVDAADGDWTLKLIRA
jgi:hypothetical protein